MDSQKKPSRKLLFLGGGAIFACLCLVIIVLVFSPGEEDIPSSTQVAGIEAQKIETIAPVSVETNTPDPTNTPAPSNTPVPTRIPTNTPNPNLIKPGTYLVNDEIKPGIYQGEGYCYWERLKDLSGSFDAIIANGNSVGQLYIEVKDSDFAFSTDCDVIPLESLPEPSEELLQIIQPGIYIVGRDVQPGIYRGEGTCYWERLKDVSGGFDAINANGNSVGQFYVEVKDSDFALSTDCEMVALESLPDPSGEPLQMIQPGVYLVDRDILPGRYRGEGTCYWERLKDVSGSFDAIIANGNSEGQFYIEVKESDFAISTDCEVERVED